MRRFDIESIREGGAQIVSVAGNVTVASANYVLDETNLTRTGPMGYRLDVNTSRDTQKPDQECPSGGVVRYEVTVRLPVADGIELEIRHDGERISGIGAGGES